MSALPNLLTQWSRLVIGTLKNAGVTDLVVSPGSRSSSLVAAACADKELALHGVLDERAAGFFALGLARSRGVPPVLICTSGSALSHYLPALIEATQSHLPLLVLSADRPQELQAANAPQTIHQAGIFGRYAKACFSLGEPNADGDCLRALARQINQGYSLSLSGIPGPVHFNFPARKPLEPSEDYTHEQRELTTRVSDLLTTSSAQFPPPELVAPDEAIEELARRFTTHPDLLLSVGPIPTSIARSVVELGNRQEVFVFCEQPGLATPVDGLARGLLGRRNQSLPTPSCIIHVGPPPISSAWQSGLKTLRSELCCVGADEHPDPTSRARLVVRGSLTATLERLAGRLQHEPILPGRSRFTASYLRGAEAIHDAIERQTALSEYRRQSMVPGAPPAARALPEPAVVAALLSVLPQGAQLCLGNSLPIRLAAWVAPVASPRDVTVHVQRGASGIDGLIAGCAGVSIGSGRPTVLLAGDVSVAHDISSLAIARGVSTPLCICLLDNAGGRIFEHLPLSHTMSQKPEWRLWTSPPEVDFASIAKGYSVAYQAPDTLDGVKKSLIQALETPRATVLCIKTDPDSSLDFLRSMGAGTFPHGGFN